METTKRRPAEIGVALSFQDATCEYCEKKYMVWPTENQIRELRGRQVQIIVPQTMGVCDACSAGQQGPRKPHPNIYAGTHAGPV